MAQHWEDVSQNVCLKFSHLLVEDLGVFNPRLLIPWSIPT